MTTYDVLAFGAHPDDMESVMGGTMVKLTRLGLTVLLVDLTDGEPARYGDRGQRAAQARKAAEILGVDRRQLEFPDRMLRDTIDVRMAVARLIRTHRPSMVFATAGSGVHPDHKAATEIVINGVFYARLPKWDQVPGGAALADSEPHEIERLFFGHCRMESPWERFDFAVDVTDVYDVKLAALEAYESVFQGPQRDLLDRYGAEDRYVGGIVGVSAAEPFCARSPLLVEDPTVFRATRFG